MNLTALLPSFCPLGVPSAADLRAALAACANHACPESATPACVADLHGALEASGDLGAVVGASCGLMTAEFYSVYELMACLVGIMESSDYEGELEE